MDYIMRNVAAYSHSAPSIIHEYRTVPTVLYLAVASNILKDGLYISRTRYDSAFLPAPTLERLWFKYW